MANNIIMNGNLQKLKGVLKDSQVEYSLELGRTSIPLNLYIGETLHFEFTGNIYCQQCGKKTKKSFQQGYCYLCATTLARCDICIVRPEKCHFHLGTCREPEWGSMNCMIPHIIYLANTSNLKVGITREINIPTRWIDQGATQALPIARVFSRLHAGQWETTLAKEVSDKTNWRALLKGVSEAIDLKQKYHAIRSMYGENSIQWLNEQVYVLHYPVIEYPQKIQSINPEKVPKFSACLQGIKGQYLIFDKGVLNIRNLTGYEVHFRTTSFKNILHSP